MPRASIATPRGSPARRPTGGPPRAFRSGCGATTRSSFVEWLREWNASTIRAHTGFYGLDLYSLYRSIRLVLEYLDRVDPAAARTARERYGGLMTWEGDPATYGRAVVTGSYRAHEREVVAMLRDVLAREVDYAARDGEHFLDAAGNARVVANAEAYYRVMYYGGSASWNLRDQHMFETLEALLRFHGPNSKAVLWEHNSHLGDAAATEMGVRGELNVGHLCRQRFGDSGIPDAARSGTSSSRRGSSARSASSITPIRRCRAITFTPRFPTGSTNGSGSTRRARYAPSVTPRRASFRAPTPSRRTGGRDRSAAER